MNSRLMKNKIFAIIFILMCHINLSYCLESNSAIENNNLAQLKKFDNLLTKNIALLSTAINKKKLPVPYDFLLTQTLMTPGIEQFYQRRAIIKPIFVKRDQTENTYSRAILMLVDSNKQRNNVKAAQEKNEAMVVELALITMNFNELPKSFINEITTTNIPFGKLLQINQIETKNRDQQYFSIKCNSVISNYLPCKIDSQIYGRTNTIVKKSNSKLLAQVVEILSDTQGTISQDEVMQKP